MAPNEPVRGPHITARESDSFTTESLFGMEETNEGMKN